jgi:hypothetical protein
MQANGEVRVFSPGFQPYKVTAANKAVIHLIVMEDRVVACDQIQVIGSAWSTYRARMERSGAVVEPLTEAT